jgi:multiple sugar transport system ATP-binding protein
MAAIELRGMVKRFGAVTAVDNVSLSIADGEFMVLVGPSGCGKTTLLRMIAGLADADGGAVSFDGREITSEPPGQRNVAMVFQNYALFPHLTVERNLSFGLRLRRLPSAERRRRVAEVARLLRIEPLLKRFPRELSGGQKQRVALGRALIRRPVAFLFDEPLSNLDPALRVEMRAEIAALHKAFPVTTVYVTHDQVEAMTLGDRIAVMHEGHLAQTGTPWQVYHDPQDLFTASFIGSPAMNLIECRAEQHDGMLRLCAADGIDVDVGATLGSPSSVGRAAVPADDESRTEPSAPLGPVLQAAVPADIILGVRPEHLRLCAADAPGAIGAEVTLVEQLGREHIIYLKRGELALRAVMHSGPPPQLGELAHVTVELAQAFYFDAPSGRRLAVR